MKHKTDKISVRAMQERNPTREILWHGSLACRKSYRKEDEQKIKQEAPTLDGSVRVEHGQPGSVRRADDGEHDPCLFGWEKKSTRSKGEEDGYLVMRFGGDSMGGGRLRSSSESSQRWAEEKRDQQQSPNLSRHRHHPPPLLTSTADREKRAFWEVQGAYNGRGCIYRHDTCVGEREREVVLQIVEFIHVIFILSR